MGRILTGSMFKERPRAKAVTSSNWRETWKRPSGVMATAKLAGAAAKLIGGMPNPFRDKPDLSDKGLRSSSALLQRAADQRAKLTAGDRFKVATEMERRRRQSMASEVEAGRAQVQDLGGANLETPAQRQAGAGMGVTEAEARERVQALRDRAEIGTERMAGRPEPGTETTFGIVFENLRDPDKRAQMPQEALENFFQGVSSGGLKRELLNQGASGEEVNAAQEIAQMELSRRARGQAKVAEEIVDERTGAINPDDVESFDETIVELDPIYQGLVGLTRDQARSKILIAARVADTKEDQDLLRKQWEILDAPRETIADLFKSPEQIQREHRAELEERFAKLRKPAKGISAKDQAEIDLKREKITDLQFKRKKKDKNKGVRSKPKNRDVASYDKLLKENIDDIDKGMPEVAAARAKLKVLEKAKADGDPDLMPAGVTAQNVNQRIGEQRKRVRLLNQAQLRYRQDMKRFRARLRNPKIPNKKKLIEEIAEYLDGQPYFTEVNKILGTRSKVDDAVADYRGANPSG